MKNNKKMLSGILSLLMLLTAGGFSANAAETRTDVKVRDPFVLEYNGTYYMYGTGLQWPGYGCTKSTDLKNWSVPFGVFTPAEDYDGIGDWWAPECHYFNGSFYLFATYKSAASGKRGVAVFRADSPEGPFTQISDGHITPKQADAIDGTLFVDENGEPWMVYVGEWTSNNDGIGNMMLAKLSDDLTHFVSEPRLLFRADAPLWAKGSITDGPFLYRTKEGRLLMLWSNSDENGYCVGIAYSSNGRIDGKWVQQPTVLYGGSKKAPDGGHGMIFTGENGELLLSVHSPNGSTENLPTTAVFAELEDIGCTVILKENSNFFSRLFYMVYYKIADLLHAFLPVC